MQKLYFYLPFLGSLAPFLLVLIFGFVSTLGARYSSPNSRLFIYYNWNTLCSAFYSEVCVWGRCDNDRCYIVTRECIMESRLLSHRPSTLIRNCIIQYIVRSEHFVDAFDFTQSDSRLRFNFSTAFPANSSSRQTCKCVSVVRET